MMQLLLTDFKERALIEEFLESNDISKKTLFESKTSFDKFLASKKKQLKQKKITNEPT